MIEQLRDFDHFFYYGQNDIGDEVKADLLSVIRQSRRSLFYNRDQDAAGIDEFENNPNTINLTILLPYAIMEAMGKRNQNVSNGEGGTRDRRAFTSQALIRIEQNADQLNLTVPYIPGYDLRQTDAVNTQLGGF